VVALENSDVLGTPRRGRRFQFSLVAFIAVACSLLALITFAMHNFDENGLRLGSLVAWRFTFFVFFVALIAGPLARLLPFGPLDYLGEYRRQLLWGFCASFAVYLATLLVPNMVWPVSVAHDGLTFEMAAFAGFSAVVTAMIAFGISTHAGTLLGAVAGRAMLIVGLGYFWLAYAMAGLAHITGPHRPDAFYAISLSLMVTALLLRFADRFVQNWKRRAPEPAGALAL
jgi:hypothetical protein